MLAKAATALVRPIYRGLVERPLWWFLARVKAFFFAETTARLTAIEARLGALERFPGADELFRRIEVANAGQWDAIEQLLLGILSQPKTLELEADVVAPHQVMDSRVN